MSYRNVPVLFLVAVSFAAASCSGTPAARPADRPVQPPPASTTTSFDSRSPEDLAAKQALDAYEGYWKASAAAEKSPGNKDWRAELSQYLVDPELSRHVLEIQNLASVPSHVEGDYHRSPSVTGVSLSDADPRVKITDCLDRTHLHLISDKAGDARKVLDNPDQPQRYELHAEVVRYATLNNRWLVQVVQARLDKPC